MTAGPSQYKAGCSWRKRQHKMTTPPASTQKSGRTDCTWPDCGLSFTRKQDMDRHYKQLHERKLRSCPVPDCKYTASRIDKLNDHLKKSHSMDVKGRLLPLFNQQAEGKTHNLVISNRAPDLKTLLSAEASAMPKQKTRSVVPSQGSLLNIPRRSLTGNTIMRPLNTAESSNASLEHLPLPTRRLQAHPTPLDSTTQTGTVRLQAEPIYPKPLKGWMKPNFGEDYISGWCSDTLPFVTLEEGSFGCMDVCSKFIGGRDDILGYAIFSDEFTDHF